jgi:hypothetical protein
MKKILTIIITALMLTPGFAQDEQAGSSKVVNKNGVPILPEAGDIALGIDMVPFLNFVGNIANQTTNNSYNGQFLSNGNTLYGKYFLSSDMAVRGRVGLYNRTSNLKNYVQDDAALYVVPKSPDMVVDVYKYVRHDYLIGAGIEKRRGKGRLQGFFAAEVNLLFGSNKDTYTYGNSFSEINQTPTTTSFGSNLTGNGRILEDKGNTYFGVGLNGFLGVEYFIMPNVSLGSEVGWGINYRSYSQSNNVEEIWNGNAAEEITNLDSPGNNYFGYGLTNPTASLYLMFHF